MKQNMIARAALIIGGLHCLYQAVFDKHLFGNKQINLLFNLVIGASALMLVADRNYYLPFLGVSVIPSPRLSSAVPMRNPIKVTINDLPPNVNVMYWAALDTPSNSSNPWDAYGDYSNGGNSRTDESGSVTVQIECPSQYSVKQFGIIDKVLPKHLHYRFEISAGMWSQVMTKDVTC